MQPPKVEVLGNEHKLLTEPEDAEVDAAADAYRQLRHVLTGLQIEVSSYVWSRAAHTGCHSLH